MLSKDEIRSGTTFILKLWDVVGVPSVWVETLQGDAAARWYDIYRNSDWEALQAEAAGVFRNRVTEAEAEAARRADGRCVFIRTMMVETGELGTGGGSFQTP